MLKTRWKPHKSKDHNFLRRSYTQFFLSTPKKIFFVSLEKKSFWKKYFFSPQKHFRSKWSKSGDLRFFSFEIFDAKIFRFWTEKFSDFFFEWEKNYFFSELRFFFGYSFDVKRCDLSIYDVSRAFWVLQIRFMHRFMSRPILKSLPETHHLASEQPQGWGSSRWGPKVCPGHDMSRPVRGAIRSGAAPRDLFFAFSLPNTLVIYIFGRDCFHFFIFLFLQTRNRSLGHNGENDRLRTDIQKTLEIEQIFVPPQYLAGAGKHVFRAPNALKI